MARSRGGYRVAPVVAAPQAEHDRDMTITDHIASDVRLPLGTWHVDPAHSTVAFAVRDMAHIFATVHGRFTDFEGVVDVSLEGARASGAIRVASLTTDHAVRDENLRSPEFLDAGASPEMRFVSEKLDLDEDGAVTITGRLELKGVGSDVVLHGTVLGWGTDHRGVERLALTAEGALPFGPMKVKLRVDVSAIRAS
jgi:polyisoprenoid-binding protein YceI